MKKTTWSTIACCFILWNTTLFHCYVLGPYEYESFEDCFEFNQAFDIRSNIIAIWKGGTDYNWQVYITPGWEYQLVSWYTKWIIQQDNPVQPYFDHRVTLLVGALMIVVYCSGTKVRIEGEILYSFRCKK